MKILKLLSSALFVSVILTGCGGGESKSSNPEQPTMENVNPKHDTDTSSVKKDDSDTDKPNKPPVVDISTKTVIDEPEVIIETDVTLKEVKDTPTVIEPEIIKPDTSEFEILAEKLMITPEQGLYLSKDNKAFIAIGGKRTTHRTISMFFKDGHVVTGDAAYFDYETVKLIDTYYWNNLDSMDVHLGNDNDALIAPVEINGTLHYQMKLDEDLESGEMHKMPLDKFDDLIGEYVTEDGNKLVVYDNGKFDYFGNCNINDGELRQLENDLISTEFYLQDCSKDELTSWHYGHMFTDNNGQLVLYGIEEDYANKIRPFMDVFIQRFNKVV